MNFRRLISFLPGLDNLSTRDKFVINFIRSLPEGSTLLDVGAGDQPYRSYADHLRYVAQDFCQYEGLDSFGIHTNEKWDTSRIDIVSDITSIPIAEDSIDFILCTEVLEHIPDPAAAICELSRIVKHGGSILLTAPLRSLPHQLPYFYFSGFSRQFYNHQAAINSLSIEKIYANGSYLGEHLQEFVRIYRFLPLYCQIFFTPLFASMYIVLLCISKFYSSRLPESCYGYFVLFTKH